MYADLVAFNYDKVKETRNYAKPSSYPEGIEYVLVNGEIALAEGITTGVLAGKVI